MTDKEKIVLFEKYIRTANYPLELKSYTEEERRERDHLPPMYWSQRDWKDWDLSKKNESSKKIKE